MSDKPIVLIQPKNQISLPLPGKEAPSKPIITVQPKVDLQAVAAAQLLKQEQLPFGNGAFTIASFDIGIYNLAFCILSYHPELPSGCQYKVYQWEIINLLSEKKLNCSRCSHRASYQHREDPNTGYCQVHARPLLSSSPESLERHLRIDTATNLDYNVQIIKALDRYPQLLQCDEVILESQPEFGTQKMKNIAAMIFSYFACRAHVDHPDSKIKNISSVYSKNKMTVYDGPEISCPTFKKSYDRNKYLSKQYCKALLQRDPAALAIFQEHRKQDDLADCFLQGAWYLRKEQLQREAKSKRSKNPAPVVEEIALLSG